MPRLSLYKPEKSADYRFLDRNIKETFQIGGTDIFVHKYLGPQEPTTATPSTPAGVNDIPETKIQDLLFLENRDRKYSDDVYSIRGIYNVQDIDFDLSQFGMFLQNDTVFVTFHLNSSVEAIGRKLMSGDVIELPHLKDEYALNDFQVALKRFYVIEDINRSAEGFSQTWYPHLLRAKCKPVMDSQEFKDIFDKESGEEGKSLRDVMSTFDKEMQINQAVLNQAAEDVALTGYDTDQFFVLPTDKDGNVDNIDGDSTQAGTLQTPSGNYYVGYLTGNAKPANGATYSFGLAFPQSSAKGDYFLRTDYSPNRLFRYDGDHWIKVEDNVRTVPPSGTTTKTQLGTFVNNTATRTVDGVEVDERQALSKALKPEADN